MAKSASKGGQKRKKTTRRGPRRAARRLWPEIARLRVSGLTQQQIGDEVGRSHSMISDTLRVPEVVEMMNKLRAAEDERFLEQRFSARNAAMDYLLELVRDEGEATTNRVAAARTILQYTADTTPLDVRHTGRVEVDLVARVREVIRGLPDEDLGILDVEEAPLQIEDHEE